MARKAIRTNSPAKGDQKLSLAARFANGLFGGVGGKVLCAPEKLESIGGVSSTENI